MFSSSFKLKAHLRVDTRALTVISVVCDFNVLLVWEVFCSPFKSIYSNRERLTVVC